MLKSDAEEARARPPEMEDAEVYRKQLELFIRCSTDKRIELVRIGEVIADLRHRRRFLDVGAGSGDLTIPLAQTFRETSIVEPNTAQIEFLRRRYPDFKLHNTTWSEADLGGERFDFILCSHVLYYLDTADWMPSIDKMRAHLEADGRLAIVLQSPIGELADFYNRFAHFDVDILGLWRQLIHSFGDRAVDVRYFINEIWTDNLDDMVEIGLFLLIDRNFRARCDEIRDYFARHHRHGDGYRLKQDEVLLVVRPQSS
jgi:SAM-dependent methyltransferase